MLKVTNVSTGPRGFNAVSGPINLDRGQSTEAKVFEREREHMEVTQWFDIKGDYEPNPSASDSEKDARITDLERQIAELKGDGGGDRKTAAAALLAKAEDMHFQTFRKQAGDILGADAPDTKAEIIAALEKAAA